MFIPILMKTSVSRHRPSPPPYNDNDTDFFLSSGKIAWISSITSSRYDSKQSDEFQATGKINAVYWSDATILCKHAILKKMAGSPEKPVFF